MTKTVFCVAAVAAMLSAATSLAYAKDPMVGGAAMFASKNIIENAVNSKDHTTLVAAVKAAGLVGTLEGKGPFTVFAPTNEAFEKLPSGTVETLLKPENKEKLVKVLTCHVVAGDDMAAAIRKWAKSKGGEYDLKTVGGCTIKAMAQGGRLTLTDEAGGTAQITIADVKQSNGVIHVVDKVLLPKM
ncbi:fasciclin domain-containing protein [Rhizobium sp. P40RR-XXII]|uniref:fasciclin domain-containing protein n=1 Tax=unclassified Rhizobium TaxID=2613769 RepID=UPI00145743FF|nr:MULTISPECIES: fasciclin domain-containing protein [unclassified Rhizobium]NLR87577.1 fasciclin domain-containing protein [Rhizobium sp. P28RR-XV]NLS18237.1 fasciclin domain-containing protein [Rhizobium sp. P40RR-XXII]